MKKLIALFLTTALFLTSCASADDTKSTNEEDLNIVRTNITAEPDSLDPWKSAATDTAAIFNNVFDGLMLYNERGEITLGLASDYKISEDGLTYTFTLRENVVFHNGQPFTSADVLYTYNNLAGLDGNEAVTGKFSAIESIEAPDDYTFIINLKEPSGAFLSLTIQSILPQGYTQQALHPIGTGPYKFVSYTPGQKVVLEKNDNFYDEDRMPSIQTAEIYIMSDNSAISLALQSGQLDFAQISGDNVLALEGIGFNILSSPQNMVQLFAVNNEIAPFNNLKVRQALNYAINKEEVIFGAFNGYATEIYSNFSPVMDYYYNDSLTDVYSYNKEKAIELLKEAGYEDGFSLEITVPSNYVNHMNSAQIIVNQLADVGITATINPVEWGTWLDEVYEKANYEATIIGLTGKLDPDAILGRYESSYSANFMNFSNERYDEIISLARFETHEETRVNLYKEAQEILTNEAAAVYISDPNLIVAARSELKGYTFYPVGFIDFSKLYYEM